MNLNICLIYTLSYYLIYLVINIFRLLVHLNKFLFDYWKGDEDEKRHVMNICLFLNICKQYNLCNSAVLFAVKQIDVDALIQVWIFRYVCQLSAIFRSSDLFKTTKVIFYPIMVSFHILHVRLPLICGFTLLYFLLLDRVTTSASDLSGMCPHLSD